MVITRNVARSNKETFIGKARVNKMMNSELLKDRSFFNISIYEPLNISCLKDHLPVAGLFVRHTPKSKVVFPLITCSQRRDGWMGG